MAFLFRANGRNEQTLMRVLLTAGLMVAFVLPIQAQDLQGLSVEKSTVGPTENVEFVITTGSNNSNAWCGLRLEFGNGDYRDIRVGEASPVGVPIRINYRYTAPGAYVARVDGKLLIRGLKSLIPCFGPERTVQVLVENSDARRVADELKRRLEIQEAQQKALIEKERELMKREAEIDAKRQRDAVERSRLAIEERERLVKQRELDLSQGMRQQKDSTDSSKQEPSASLPRRTQAARETTREQAQKVDAQQSQKPVDPSASSEASKLPQSQPRDEPSKPARPTVRSATDL